MGITTNDDQLYSIADIARYFSLPESTCRYYCKRFSPYIPTVGEGRRRRYRKTTLDVIQAILEEMKKSRTANAVEDALAIRFPRNALMVQQHTLVTEQKTNLPSEDKSMIPPVMLTFMERQTVALEGIATMLNLLMSHLTSHTALPEVQNSSIDDLKKEVSRLAILLDASEKNQQADLEQLRTWMARFLKTTGKTANAS
ncbi:MAG: MerR family transcriptional regulator [Desulfovibrio sp.]|nr:MerR family transcriptional regulator [Desulfovibrio sp.]